MTQFRFLLAGVLGCNPCRLRLLSHWSARSTAEHVSVTVARWPAQAVRGQRLPNSNRYHKKPSGCISLYVHTLTCCSSGGCSGQQSFGDRVACARALPCDRWKNCTAELSQSLYNFVQRELSFHVPSLHLKISIQ